MENHAPATVFGRLPNPDFFTDIPASDKSRAAVIAGLAFLIWTASVLLIVVVPAIFLMPYIAAQGIDLTNSDALVEFAKTDMKAVVIQVAAVIPAHLLTLGLAWLIVSRGKKYSLRRTLGWDSGGVRWWHYAMILGAFFIIAALVGNFFPEQENDLIRILKSSRWAVYTVAIVATVTAPLVEEVIYRGILYSAFEKATGTAAAFVVVTLLFAVVHVPQYYPSYSTIFLLTLLSITLTAVRVWSGRLLPCIILHTLFNGLQSIMLLLDPGVSTTDVPEPVNVLILPLLF